MLVSSNGVSWTTVNLDAAGPASVPNGLPFGGLTFGAGRFLAVGGTTGGASLFLTSTDGITWKEQAATYPTAAGPGPITYGNWQLRHSGTLSSLKNVLSLYFSPVE